MSPSGLAAQGMNWTVEVNYKAVFPVIPMKESQALSAADGEIPVRD